MNCWYGVSWGGWECSQSTCVLAVVVSIEKPGRIRRNGADTRNILMVYCKTAVSLGR